MNRPPVISVLLLAYQHEAFIEQAIKSVVAQVCEQDFEIVIGDDASTDGTHAICERMAQAYPERVRLLPRTENLGMHGNFARLWKAAKGKYIAILEGDDYWLDPGKLAKQVAFLEARPEFSMCGTLTRCIRRSGEGVWVEAGYIGPAEQKESYNVEDLIPSYSFHTSSVLIRREMICFPRWFSEVYCVDRPLYLLGAEQGPVGLIPEVTSCYRMHGGGAWSPASLLYKAERGIHLFERIDEHFAYRYERLIQRTVGEILWSYLWDAHRTGQLDVARRLFWMATRYRLREPIRTGRSWLGMGARLYWPTQRTSG